ncbi:hypothetical protein L6258_01030, partial [Candidatus Parcubacteria bacterium]|nr:hypothetical protein [Candidatus Parcubacteria bacterium]
MNLPTVLKTPLGRKQVRALVSLAAVFLILPLVSLAVQYPQRYRGRAAAEAVPENVAITNIYSQGFSVSWTT